MTWTSKQHFARIRQVKCNTLSAHSLCVLLSLYFFLSLFLLLFSFSCCILSFSPSEHLWADWPINYLYWTSVPVLVLLVDRPYHCQSISNVASVRLRQTSRRNQPIYCGTMGQHDSIVSCRFCINRPLSFFLKPDRHLYPVLRTTTLLPPRPFNHNSVRGLNQTVFGSILLDKGSSCGKK